MSNPPPRLPSSGVTGFEESSLHGLQMQDHQVLAQRIYLLEQINANRRSEDEFVRQQATEFCRIAPSVKTLEELGHLWEMGKKFPGGPFVLISLWTFGLALIEAGAISLIF